MIKSFKQKWAAELLYHGEESQKAAGVPLKQARKKLRMIKDVCVLLDLRTPPGNRLEKLKGYRSEEWSIRINDQWRICFRWHENNAHDVSVEDYHS